MRDGNKTKAQLIEEIETLRRRVAEIENSENELIEFRGIDLDVTERKGAETTSRIREWAIESSINAIAIANLMEI